MCPAHSNGGPSRPIPFRHLARTVGTALFHEGGAGASEFLLAAGMLLNLSFGALSHTCSSSLRAMSSLRAERDAVAEQLRLLWRNEKRLLENGRCAKPDVSTPRACPSTWVTAQLVFHMSDGSREAAEDYMLVKRRNKVDKLVSELRIRMTTWAALPADALASWMTEHGAEERRTTEARRFLTEFGLKKWVVEQNAAKAIAPTRRCLSEQSMLPTAVGAGSTTGSRDLGRRTGGDRGEKQWLRRWARRFAMRRGGFQVGPSMDAAEMLAKAAGNGTGAHPKS